MLRPVLETLVIWCRLVPSPLRLASWLETKARVVTVPGSRSLSTALCWRELKSGCWFSGVLGHLRASSLQNDPLIWLSCRQNSFVGDSTLCFARELLVGDFHRTSRKDQFSPPRQNPVYLSSRRPTNSSSQLITDLLIRYLPLQPGPTFQ